MLADQVIKTELSIAEEEFADIPLHELLLQLHRCICVDLTPKIAGCWRLQDVLVGTHEPPQYWKIPTLMHNYTANMEVRLADFLRNPEYQKAINDLTFAEGQLLHIHPFADFNGHVSRLFIIELLRRMKLQDINLAITSSCQPDNQYLEALRTYDCGNYRLLSTIWEYRLSH